MLHPLGLITALVKSVRSIVSMFVSLAIVLRMALRDAPEWAACALIVAAVGLTLAQPIIRWASTRYRLGRDSLEFRSGLFFRRHRTIGYGSVHAVDSSSPVYMRPFGIVQLTVSAAGAADTTVTLDAVPAALQLELERLRARVQTHADETHTDETHTDETHTDETHASTETTDTETMAAAGRSLPATGPTGSPSIQTVQTIPAAPAIPPVPGGTLFDGPATGSPVTAAYAPGAVPPASSTAIPSPTPTPVALPANNAPVFRASVRDITLYALTDLGFIAAAFVVFGFVQNLEDWVPREWVWSARRSVGDYAAQGATAVLLLVLVCAIVLMAVSVVTSLLRFHGFEVWRRGDDLIVVRGLFTRRTTTIPVSRIQTIVVRRSLLRRPFHLCSVGLGLSSSVSGDGEESGISAARILPVIGMARVYDVLRAMLPEWDVHEPDNEASGTMGAMPGNPRLRRTGRDLLRYYVTMPILVTCAATAAVAAGTTMAVDGMPLRWLFIVPLAIGLWWTLSRALKSRTEGYAILADSPDSSGSHSTATEPVDDTSSPSVRPDSESTSTAIPSPLPHRILVTGANGMTTFAMTTRRSRVQSITRSTTPWREPHGIEQAEMPLFVLNGISALQFTFLRRADAEALEAWLTRPTAAQ